jgi:hypothetical protein
MLGIEFKETISSGNAGELSNGSTVETLTMEQL